MNLSFNYHNVYKMKFKNLFKRKFRRYLLILFLGFAVLFTFRLIYGYTTTETETIRFEETLFNEPSNFGIDNNNYASTKYRANVSTAPQGIIQVDQKYEQIAVVQNTSTEFDKEEKLVKVQIKKMEGLIQYEQKSGNEGNRLLNLVIGVSPEKFDDLHAELIKIGNVKINQITKTDKTNEYNELNARRVSLENLRASLTGLKSKSGKIEEFMQLENRILEIDQQLQTLGVSLGDFDEEKEFCTIRFSLSETKEIKTTISLMYRIKVAFEWAVKFYLGLISILILGALFSYLVLLTVEKFKIVMSNMNDNE